MQATQACRGTTIPWKPVSAQVTQNSISVSKLFCLLACRGSQCCAAHCWEWRRKLRCKEEEQRERRAWSPLGLGAQVHAELPHYLGRLCWKKCRNQVNCQDDVRFGLRHCSPQIHSFLMAKETVNSSRGTGRGDQQGKGASHTSSAREQNIRGPSGKD